VTGKPTGRPIGPTPVTGKPTGRPIGPTRDREADAVFDRAAPLTAKRRNADWPDPDGRDWVIGDELKATTIATIAATTNTARADQGPRPSRECAFSLGWTVESSDSGSSAIGDVSFIDPLWA